MKKHNRNQGELFEFATGTKSREVVCDMPHSWIRNSKKWTKIPQIPWSTIFVNKIRVIQNIFPLKNELPKNQIFNFPDNNRPHIWLSTTKLNKITTNFIYKFVVRMTKFIDKHRQKPLKLNENLIKSNRVQKYDKKSDI